MYTSIKPMTSAKIAVTKNAERILLRLVDSEGRDRGMLDQISLATQEKP